MNNSEKHASDAIDETVAVDMVNPHPDDAVVTADQHQEECRETRRWWIKLVVQPALLLACGAILITGLGIAQRMGFISAGGASGQSHISA